MWGYTSYTFSVSYLRRGCSSRNLIFCNECFQPNRRSPVRESWTLTPFAVASLRWDWWDILLSNFSMSGAGVGSWGKSVAGVSSVAVTSTSWAGSTRSSVEVFGAVGASFWLASFCGRRRWFRLACRLQEHQIGQLTPAVRFQPVRGQPGAASSALYPVTDLEVR